MMRVRLQEDAIDATALERELITDADGAVVTFLGTVRDHNQGRAVRAMEYHAYPEMAESEMRKIAEAALGRFEITDVALVHRTGRLEIGEASVAVVVVSPHRAPGFDACRFIIDELKQTVPIWKRELVADGAVWIEGEGS